MIEVAAIVNDSGKFGKYTNVFGHFKETQREGLYM